MATVNKLTAIYTQLQQAHTTAFLFIGSNSQRTSFTSFSAEKKTLTMFSIYSTFVPYHWATEWNLHEP